MMTLEQQVLRAWQAWGHNWVMSTRCHDCGEVVVCRGKTKRLMLCLHCFDQRGMA